MDAACSGVCATTAKLANFRCFQLQVLDPLKVCCIRSLVNGFDLVRLFILKFKIHLSLLVPLRIDGQVDISTDQKAFLLSPVSYRRAVGKCETLLRRLKPIIIGRREVLCATVYVKLTRSSPETRSEVYIGLQ